MYTPRYKVIGYRFIVRTIKRQTQNNIAPLPISRGCVYTCVYNWDKEKLYWWDYYFFNL